MERLDVHVFRCLQCQKSSQEISCAWFLNACALWPIMFNLAGGGGAPHQPARGMGTLGPSSRSSRRLIGYPRANIQSTYHFQLPCLTSCLSGHLTIDFLHYRPCSTKMVVLTTAFVISPPEAECRFVVRSSMDFSVSDDSGSDSRPKIGFKYLISARAMEVKGIQKRYCYFLYTVSTTAC